MEKKCRDLISASLAEAMQAFIKGVFEALRANPKNEGGSRKHTKSKKSVEKIKIKRESLI
jgi:hypothetical protein